MIKLNNKGFVMAETLVVAVFIMVIFGIMYNNYYPLIGEYERREVFDDIDSKYAAFWVKRFIQHSSYNLSSADIDSGTGYVRFDCNMINDEHRKTMCNRLTTELEISSDVHGLTAYITKYNLTEFKALVKADENYETFSGGFHDYVEYLPIFKMDSLNFANYSVVLEFHRKKNENDFYSYSTIEVKK